MSNETREDAKFISAILTLLVGLGLVIGSLFIPPEGVIHSSVLCALGELLTFTGAVFGIGEYTKVQIHKIGKNFENKKEEL